MADNIKYGFGKYIWIIGAITLFGGLFAYLESIGLEIECEDKVCEQGVECSIDCSVYNPTYSSKYLYNYGNWPITFTPSIQEFKLYAKYYGKWRFTNFTRETRFTNIPDKALYVFVFPRRTTKYFQVRVILNSTQRIKWNFGKLDPVIVGYDYIYENKSRVKSIYTIVCTPVKTPDLNNESHVEDCVYVISYKTVYYDGKRIGVEVNEKETLGYVNIDGDILSKWAVPIGDRNFEEFGTCRPFEIDKGVCKEIDLLK